MASNIMPLSATPFSRKDTNIGSPRSPFQFNLAISPSSPIVHIDKQPSISKIADNYPVFLVIDTNIFIHHFTYVRQLVNREDLTFLLVVPGIVIHELDLQKKREGIAHLSRAASSWIRHQSQSSRLFIRLQQNNETMKPCKSWRERHRGECNDDIIVDCCRYYAQYGKTFLCSYDTNICLKAEADGIPAIDPWDLEGTTARYQTKGQRPMGRLLDYETPTKRLKGHCGIARRSPIMSPLRSLAHKSISTPPRPPTPMRSASRKENRVSRAETREPAKHTVPPPQSNQAIVPIVSIAGASTANDVVESLMEVDIRRGSFPAAEVVHKRNAPRFANLLVNLARRVASSSRDGQDVLNSRQIDSPIPSVVESVKYLANSKQLFLRPELVGFFEEHKMSTSYSIDRWAEEWEKAMRGIVEIADAFGDVKLWEEVNLFDTDCFVLLFGRRMK